MIANPTFCQMQTGGVNCLICSSVTSDMTKANSSYCIGLHFGVRHAQLMTECWYVESCSDNCIEPVHDSCTIRSNACAINGTCALISLPDMTSCFLGSESAPYGVCITGRCVDALQSCTFANNQLSCSSLRKEIIFFCNLLIASSYMVDGKAFESRSG